MFTLLIMPALSVKIINPLLLKDKWTNLAGIFEFVLNLDNLREQ